MRRSTSPLVREALQRLAREWLVVIMPRRGIFVSEIDVARQFRRLDARRVLERLLAQSAAHRCSRGQRAQFAAAGNEFAAGSMGLMTGLSRRFCHLHYRQVADLPLAARLHAATPRAVAAGQAIEAGAASDALVDYIEAFARKTIE